jgi:hypothetical protein
MELEHNLIAAVQQRDTGLVAKLLSEGANVSQLDEQGWTPLHWAAGAGDAGIVRLLLDHGADIAATGRDNRTALMVARAAGRHDVVALLTQSEKTASIWKDPRESRPYCKAFYLKDLQGFSQWPRDNTAESDADAILYLHQDFTVAKSVWAGEDVVFNQVTPEWIQYCHSRLNFSIPADLV